MDIVYLAGGIGAGILLIAVVISWLVLQIKNRGVPDATTPKILSIGKATAMDEKLSSEFVLNAIEDGVIMVDYNGVIRFFNAAAAKISGWQVAEAVGLDFRSIVVLVDYHGQQYQPQNHPFARALAESRTIRDSALMLATRSGKQIAISLIVSPVVEKAGLAASMVVGVMRDITAEREEENRRSEFISTASHEMRTPIAAIEGYLSLALNPKVSNIDERAKKYLEKAHSSTQHLSELFQDLLMSSKAEDGRIASRPTAVELGEVLEQIAEGARFNARSKGLELKLFPNFGTDTISGKVVRPPYYVYVDPNRIREVIQNIVDNAIKYTLRGYITLSLGGDDSVVQVQVSDTGQGIPDEDIPHLFQKFYRVDNSMTRSIGGTGLGLFISKKIVELYNGRIWVESEQGKGSTFFINLPRLGTQQAMQLQKLYQNIPPPINTTRSVIQ